MSTLKVDTIDTSDSSGNITVSRPLVGSGASLTALNATELTSGTVATARLGSGTANNTVFLRGDGTWATAGSTSASDLTSGTLPIARIADDAITTAKIAPDAITAAKVADDVVNSEHYAAASIDNEHLADDAVGVAELSASGTASSSTFLRGDNSWVAIPDEITKSSSDPTISTNPSGGVGTVFINTTSGETYVCTTATAGANVWTNVGGGSGDIEPWSFQGEVAGYAVSGMSSGPNTFGNVIQKWSFTSTSNATDVGDCTSNITGAATAAGQTHGYAAGGSNGVANHNVIQKWSFTSDANATDVGDTAGSKWYASGQSSSTYGYTSGGSPHSNPIEKYSTTSDGNATDVGDLTGNKAGLAGQSSSTHGYSSAGEGPAPAYTTFNVIEKFSFSSDGNATDVGDLTVARWAATGQSSTTHGYTSGGSGSGADVIDKFTFASNANATDVGNMLVGQFGRGGASATSYGYIIGGGDSAGNNVIERFSFSSDGNSTDHADLINNLGKYISATQY